jgi:phosphate transport system substrate-binding protein
MKLIDIWNSTKIIIVLALLFNHAQAASLMLGVGATFPKQVYQGWGKQYKAETGSALAYFAQGSGKGIEAILSQKADFGASDKPLTIEELERNALIQFPILIGGVVPVVNLERIGNGQLQLDGVVLADIYMGKIKRWNNPAITALNPGLTLPNEVIKIAYRSDKSGSTYVLSEYLSKVSSDWKNVMGAGTTVAWRVGEGFEGGDKLAKQISDTPNSIGYLDPALVQQRHLTYVKMRNHDGVFVSPNQASFAAAVQSAKWSESTGYNQSLTNLPGHESWPLTTATYIIVSRSPKEVSGTEESLKYFDWSFRNGNQIAQNLGFVMLPTEAMQSIRESWKMHIKDRAGNSLWK